MANGHGGARKGAGRKSRLEKFGGEVAAAEKRIADRLPDLIDSLFELAQGVTVSERDEDGGEIVYTKPPDRQAAQYLVDRVMGKPTERVEAEVDGQVVIRVTEVEVDV